MAITAIGCELACLICLMVALGDNSTRNRGSSLGKQRSAQTHANQLRLDAAVASNPASKEFARFLLAPQISDLAFVDWQLQFFHEPLATDSNSAAGALPEYMEVSSMVHDFRTEPSCMPRQFPAQ